MVQSQWNAKLLLKKNKEDLYALIWIWDDLQDKLLREKGRVQNLYLWYANFHLRKMGIYIRNHSCVFSFVQKKYIKDKPETKKKKKLNQKLKKLVI